MALAMPSPSMSSALDMPVYRVDPLTTGLGSEPMALRSGRHDGSFIGSPQKKRG
jgi:hypothetical protein